MLGKLLNPTLLILLLVGCFGTSHYAIQFEAPEQYFEEDRYYVNIDMSTNESSYGEDLYFKNGTVFHASVSLNDSLGTPIRTMSNKRIDEFVYGEENPHLYYTYGKSYYSSWGRYTIKGDTLFITELANYEITAYRLFGWKKRNHKLLIRSDTLLYHHYKTGELVPDSIGYSVYNPQVKLDFMDSRKAWIYRYNEYPDLK